jgi:DNA-binding NtrC family response regulator
VIADLYEILKGKRIVLIDDDPWVLDSLNTFMEYKGCSLKTFDNAAEAMAAFSTEHYDVIICDYWLPEMDGITLLSLSRETQPEAIRLLVTAYPRADIHSPENRKAYEGFILKPLTIQKLEMSLDGLLEKFRDEGRGV